MPWIFFCAGVFPFFLSVAVAGDKSFSSTFGPPLRFKVPKQEKPPPVQDAASGNDRVVRNPMAKFREIQPSIQNSITALQQKIHLMARCIFLSFLFWVQISAYSF
jgi:hypothetical protein